MRDFVLDVDVDQLCASHDVQSWSVDSACIDMSEDVKDSLYLFGF